MALTPADRTDAELCGLVRRARSGDRAAFELLYRDFVRVVHGVALAHAGPRDAEDVTQEVFMQAFLRLSDLRDEAAFPAWLCSTARNQAIDRRRGRRRQPAPAELTAAEELPAADAAPVTAAASSEVQQRILAEVRALPDAYRETLVLRLVEGLTGPEIAARTGMTHGSVRVNLSRGMALLRPRLLEAGLA